MSLSEFDPDETWSFNESEASSDPDNPAAEPAAELTVKKEDGVAEVKADSGEEEDVVMVKVSHVNGKDR